MRRFSVLLLAVAAVLILPHTDGAAVLDLINLFHQYEDDILGRGQGVNPEPDAVDDESESGKPVEVHGWDSNLKVGQVTAVDVNLDDDPVVFHRGSAVWDMNSFGPDNHLKTRNLIKENTILVVDADKGRVKSSFGANIFYMPHGLHVDGAGNTWVTDVGLHQVMKFEAGQTKPSLVLGTAFMSGDDKNHFCKPTSVAVASSGHIFVGDGYCNSRVAVFSASGDHLHDIRGDWSVVHSIVLYEAEDAVCVADREGKKIDCVGAGLRSPQFMGQVSSRIDKVGRVYGITGRGSALLAVNGKGARYDPPVRGVTIDLGSDNAIIDTWGHELINPHDVALSHAGDAVYVAEIGPNRLRKFEVITPAAEIF